MAQDTTPTGSTTRLVQENNKTSPCVAPLCRCLSTTMVALSLTFSMGNILRLPTMAYFHGGGTFLVIYGVMCVLVGVPLAFLEIVLGQFCQQGTTKLWRAVPILKGVGYVKIISSLMLAVYYPAVMAIALFFSLWSIKGPLPFSECAIMVDDILKDVSGDQCLSHTFLKPPDEDPMWFGVVITLLFLLWAFIMLCVSRGAKSVRLSAAFIVCLSIGCFTALLSQQFTLGSTGYMSLLNFSWDPVLKFDTWYYALIQVFFSTHIGFGNITTFAGNIYSKSNAFWTALFFVLFNVMVGVGMTILVYMWLGDISMQKKLFSVPELFVLTLIYDVSWKFLGELPWLWSSLGYLLIILAGFASMAALVYTLVVSAVVETKNKYRSWLITASTCAVSFIISILLMLPNNWEVFRMLDQYIIGRLVAMTTALELIGFLWIYGSSNLCNDFEFVLGQKLSPIWTFIWFISPLIIVGLELASVFLIPLQWSRDPPWMLSATWGFYGTMWFIIFICAIWQISLQVDYNFGQRVMSSVKPSRKWGPVDPMYRHGWVQWRDQYQATGERDFTLKRRGTRDYTHSVKTEQRYNTMSLPRTTPSYIVQLPHGLDMSDHVCWRKEDKKGKT